MTYLIEDRFIFVLRGETSEAFQNFELPYRCIAFSEYIERSN